MTRIARFLISFGIGWAFSATFLSKDHSYGVAIILIGLGVSIYLFDKD